MESSIHHTSDRQERRTVVLRRLRTIPIVVAGFAAATVLFPVLALGAAVTDAIRGGRKLITVRLVAIGWVYFAAETLGLILLGLAWAGTGAGRLRRPMLTATYAIQRWWAGAIFATVRSALGLRFHVEGADAVAPGPIVVLMRHASIVDNLLPAAFIASPYRIRLRYVLKRELLSDPALDVAGSRLPNYFVDRAAPRTPEIDAIRSLGMGLRHDEGVLIYPEGTRFTRERQTRAVAAVARNRPELAARARALRAVLPPRTGGPLALLDIEPRADVVFAAHRGLEGFSHLRDILGGGLVGTTVRIRFWRVPIASIPAAESRRVDWLYEQWKHVDDFVAG